MNDTRLWNPCKNPLKSDLFHFPPLTSFNMISWSSEFLWNFFPLKWGLVIGQDKNKTQGRSAVTKLLVFFFMLQVIFFLGKFNFSLGTICNLGNLAHIHSLYKELRFRGLLYRGSTVSREVNSWKNAPFSSCFCW